MIKSKPFYWLECDAPDCVAEYPGDGGEVTAYAGASSLAEFAPESDWLVVKGKHYCPDHSTWHCRGCGNALTEDEQGAGEYECFACAPEPIETTQKVRQLDGHI